VPAGSLAQKTIGGLLQLSPMMAGYFPDLMSDRFPHHSPLKEGRKGREGTGGMLRRCALFFTTPRKWMTVCHWRRPWAHYSWKQQVPKASSFLLLLSLLVAAVIAASLPGGCVVVVVLLLLFVVVCCCCLLFVVVTGVCVGLGSESVLRLLQKERGIQGSGGLLVPTLQLTPRCPPPTTFF